MTVWASNLQTWLAGIPLVFFMEQKRCPCHQFFSVSHASKTKAVEGFPTCTSVICYGEISLRKEFRKEQN